MEAEGQNQQHQGRIESASCCQDVPAGRCARISHTWQRNGWAWGQNSINAYDFGL